MVALVAPDVDLDYDGTFYETHKGEIFFGKSKVAAMAVTLMM